MKDRFSLSHEMRSTNVLTAAIAYAGAGLPVLALHGTTDGACDCGNPNCQSAGKHPIGTEFASGTRM